MNLKNPVIDEGPPAQLSAADRRLHATGRPSTIGPKGQMTIPAKLRKAFGVKPGTKLEVYPRLDGSFELRIVRASRIMDYLGDLAHLDTRARRRRSL